MKYWGWEGKEGSLRAGTRSLQPQGGQGSNPHIGRLKVAGRYGDSLSPPDYVPRIPEGAQARRVGWTMLLPPSLGVEIQAIRQVGLAPSSTPTHRQPQF